MKHAWLLGLALAAGTAEAKPLKTVPAALDPTKAYALVELRNYDGGKAPASLILARYDVANGDVRGGARAPGSALPKGVSVRERVGKSALAKAKGSKLYLLELAPDDYVIEGAQSTAFSLGSKRFTLAPGQVVDLGVAEVTGDYPPGKGPYKLTAGKLMKAALLGPFAKGPKPQPAMAAFRARGAGDLPVPAGLRGRVTDVAFVSGAKFGNYLGGLVNRVDGRAGRPGGESAAD